MRTFRAKLIESFAVVIIFIGALLIVVINLILFNKVMNRIAQADREKEMMNRQVIETGKLASIGELAAGIAHEINNPVAIMVQEAGWIEDLLEEEEFKNGKNLDEFNRALKQVNIQGQRCKDITHKLLSFARKTSPGLQEVQINELQQQLKARVDEAGSSLNEDISTSLLKGNETEAPSEEKTRSSAFPDDEEDPVQATKNRS